MGISIQSSDPQIENDKTDFFTSSVHRRSFFKYAGVSTAGFALMASACKISYKASGYNLGNGDFAVLNLAYGLEQMEAAYYTRVTQNFYPGASELEKDLITDIRNNEIAHREWFRKVLALKKLPKLEFDFSSVNFNSRDSVLNTAKEMEDTGVSAYNGAGKLLKVGLFLKEAGNIVSVEARHVATIRNLISFGDFAGDDVIDKNGLDGARTPQEVISITSKFFKTKIDGSNLQKS
jgi:rubrerythrin